MLSCELPLKFAKEQRDRAFNEVSTLPGVEYSLPE